MSPSHSDFLVCVSTRSTASNRAVTSGFLSISDSDSRVPAELGQESQTSSCVEFSNCRKCLRRKSSITALDIRIGTKEISRLQIKKHIWRRRRELILLYNAISFNPHCPGMEEPGGLPSLGLHRVGHD